MATGSRLGMFGRGFDPLAALPTSATAVPTMAPGAAGGQISPTPAEKPGFFDHDGLGVSLLGNISDGILQLNGMPAQFGPVMEQRRQVQRQEAQWQARHDQERQEGLVDRLEEANRPRYFENDTGDYVQFDPASGKASVVYDGPEKPRQPTAIEQQVGYLRQLDPAMTDAQAAEVVKRGIAGAQYDPSVYRPVVDYKAGVARATKAMPTYAQTHPKARAPSRSFAPKLPTGFILD